MHILDVNIGVEQALIDSAGEFNGFSKFSIGLTAGTDAISIDEPIPTVVARLGGLPAGVQDLTVLKLANI